MTHQQLLAKMAPELEALALEVQAVRLDHRTSTVSHNRQRLGKVQGEIYDLACAARFAGAMTEETRQAFGGEA